MKNDTSKTKQTSEIQSLKWQLFCQRNRDSRAWLPNWGCRGSQCIPSSQPGVLMPCPLAKKLSSIIFQVLLWKQCISFSECYSVLWYYMCFFQNTIPWPCLLPPPYWPLLPLTLCLRVSEQRRSVDLLIIPELTANSGKGSRGVLHKKSNSNLCDVN